MKLIHITSSSSMQSFVALEALEATVLPARYTGREVAGTAGPHLQAGATRNHIGQGRDLCPGIAHDRRATAGGAP